MTLRPIVHQGQVVSITHLAPLAFACPCEDIGRDLVIEASFLNHCYTQAFDAAVHQPSEIVLYDGGSRPRVFDPIRHALSHQLPGLVAGLPGQRVNQTSQRRNYVYVVPTEIAGQVYNVFFMVRRAPAGHGAGADLLLTVESAYPTTGPLVLPKRPNSIRFVVLAYKTFVGQAVRFAPR